MEKKKSNKANLEKMKIMFFIISLGIAFAVMNYAFSVKSKESGNTAVKSEISEITEVIPITRPPDKKPLPKKTKRVIPEIITVVINTAKIDTTKEIYIPEFVDPPLTEIPEEISEKPIYNPSVKPKFPGGISALQTYIARHTEYPELAKQNNIQGTVYIKFEVTKTGTIGKVQIMNKQVDELLQNEAAKVIKSLPKFKPGLQNGKPVNVWYSLPVSFKLT